MLNPFPIMSEKPMSDIYIVVLRYEIGCCDVIQR